MADQAAVDRAIAAAQALAAEIAASGQASQATIDEHQAALAALND